MVSCRFVTQLICLCSIWVMMVDMSQNDPESTGDQLPAVSFHRRFYPRISASAIIGSSLFYSKVECGINCANIPDCKSFLFKETAKMCHLYITGLARSTSQTGKKNLQYYFKGGTSKKTRMPKMQARMLLIAPAEAHLYQVFLQNSSVQKHPHLEQRNVKALAFVPSSQRVLIALKYPNRIVSITLDGRNRSLIDKGKYVLDMTVDDAKQTVFVSSLGKGTIHRMFANGTKCTEILKLDSVEITSLSLDTMQNLIYGNAHTHVFSSTYNGENIQVIMPSTHATVLALDAELQFLYYNIGKVLYKRSMLHNTTTTIWSLSYLIFNIAYLDNNIYTSPHNGNTMEIVHLNQNRSRYVNFNSDRASCYDVVFCLIS